MMYNNHSDGNGLSFKQEAKCFNEWLVITYFTISFLNWYFYVHVVWRRNYQACASNYSAPNFHSAFKHFALSA